MKTKFSMFLFFVCANTITAQLIITPGAVLHLSGDVQLTLQNTDFINNGTFTAGNSKIFVTGNTSSSIMGSQAIGFYELQINKTAGSLLLLQREIDIAQQINFVTGNLNLNNFNINLGSTSSLNGESETSRITGTNGGQVLFNTTLNTPAGANPANLGAIITSSQNLGAVLIRRGHQSQVNSFGTGNSILRYYDILPANNTSLNATLRFQYFDAELNSFDENTTVLWKSPNNINWTSEGFTSRNTSSNYVEKTGISSFSRWTLSSLNNPLPVRFTIFNVKCEGNNVLVTWKTAQEQNSNHFNIERSADGIRWTVINVQPAAGNSSVERTYSFSDNNPVQQNFYRIAQYDVDGQSQYTSIIKATCEISDIIKVWPNPVKEMIFVSLNVNSKSQATIKVFDNKGALIKIQKSDLLPGSNQVNIDMGKLPAGIYQLEAEVNNGQINKRIQIVKQ